jgi:hypothetical protein
VIISCVPFRIRYLQNFTSAMAMSAAGSGIQADTLLCGCEKLVDY